MRGVPVRLPALNMPAAGDQFTDALDLTKGFQRGLAIFTEDVAVVGTLTIDVSYNGGTTYMTLQSGDADVNPARNKCTVLDTLPFTNLRIATDSGAEIAIVFGMVAVEDIT